MTCKRGRAPARRLLLTAPSLSDIAAIEQYSIQQFGKNAAAKFIEQIEASLALVKQDTRLLRTYAELHSSVQFYTVNQHVLAFDVHGNDRILLTVFH